MYILSENLMNNLKLSNLFNTVVLGIIVCANPSEAQNYLFESGFWKQRVLNGYTTLEGIYRDQESEIRAGNREELAVSRFNGEFMLQSNSIIWHPNFLELDMAVQYNPTLRNQQFLVLPNRSETLTAEQFRMNALFFNRRPLFLQLFGNINRIFVNREFSTNVESRRKDFGATLSYRNGYLPFSLKVNRADWQQDEKQTKRMYENTRSKFQFNTSESFGKNDDHRLMYMYEDFQRTYADSRTIRNYIHAVRMQNSLRIGKRNKHMLRSLFWWHDQEGTDDLTRLQLNETALIYLPKRFNLSVRYRYNYNDFSFLESHQNQVDYKIEHRLYESLTTYFSQEYTSLDNTNFDDRIWQSDLGLDYTKKIPTGRFSVNYLYRNRKDNRDSPSSVIVIRREEYLLTDLEPVYVDNPNVIRESFVLKDESGIIIYEENIDYILVDRGPFLEIQRLPGGQIPEGATVFADYTARQRMDYGFKAHTHRFGTRLSLLSRVINLYYNHFNREYTNIEGAADRILKTGSRNIWGIETGYLNLKAGFELEDFNSNLVPYRLKRYHLMWSKSITYALGMNINGGFRDYEMTGQEDSYEFYDVSGRVYYALNNRVRTEIQAGLRKQNGRARDLSLASIRSEISFQYRQSYLTIGYEFYYRDFISDVLRYNGGYIRYQRTF